MLDYFKKVFFTQHKKYKAAIDKAVDDEAYVKRAEYRKSLEMDA